MKKINVLKTLSLSMVAALSLNTLAYAGAVTDITKSKDFLSIVPTVNNPVYSVLLPSAVAVTIAPMSSPAIFTPALPIANKSDIPVKVTATAYTVVAAGVTQKAEGTVNFANTNHEDKEFSLKMEIIKSNPSTGGFSQTDFWSKVSSEGLYSKANYAVPKVDSTATAELDLTKQGSIEFLLAEKNPAADNNGPLNGFNTADGIAGMRISGEVNPFVKNNPWVGNDIKVTVKYVISGVPKTLYTVLKANVPTNLAGDALNVMRYTDATSTLAINDNFKVPRVAAADIKKELANQATADAEFSINLNKVVGTLAKDGDITLVNTTTGKRYLFKAADMTISQTSGSTAAKITFGAGKLIASASGSISTGCALEKTADASPATTLPSEVKGLYDVAVPLTIGSVKTTVFFQINMGEYVPAAA